MRGKGNTNGNAANLTGGNSTGNQYANLEGGSIEEKGLDTKGKDEAMTASEWDQGKDRRRVRRDKNKRDKFTDDYVFERPVKKPRQKNVKRYDYYDEDYI